MSTRIPASAPKAQVKTFNPGSARSNEGGSLPCAFAFAQAPQGWAVIVASAPVIAVGYVCEGNFCPERTPLAVYQIDCAEPGPYAAACRHAPAPRAAVKPAAQPAVAAQPRPAATPASAPAPGPGRLQ